MPAEENAKLGRIRKERLLSTESIPGVPAPAREGAERCASCGVPLADDQRYCLECGERRATVSDFLLAGPARQSAPPPAPPGFGVPTPAPRGSTVSLLAGIGVLLLAMGVGVLIGRSGSSSGKAPAPQVINVGGGGATSPSGEEPVASDWPPSKTGWTVELQTLPASSTASAVESAKTAASGKGASAVGVLKAEEFPSVGGEGFVIYAGEYDKKSEAQKALGPMKKDFPGAKLVEVSGGGTGAAGAGSATKATGGGAKPKTPSSLDKPAGAGSIGGHGHSSGKKYVEESAKLPNVVSTG